VFQVEIEMEEKIRVGSVLVNINNISPAIDSKHLLEKEDYAELSQRLEEMVFLNLFSFFFSVILFSLFVSHWNIVCVIFFA